MFFLTKEDSKIMYSIAIILMLFHHVSGFPEWYNNGYVYSINLFIEQPLALYGGKLCVAIYAFISGYGLYISIVNKKSNVINYIMNHLWNFYTHYWIVFFIFIPLNIFFEVWNYDIFHLLLVFLGCKSYYNETWWYVLEYIRILIYFPVIYSLILYFEKIIRKKFFNYFFLLIICLIISKFDPYLSVFINGIMFAKYHLFEKLDSITSNKIFSIILSFILLLSILFFRSFMILSFRWDFIIIPFFIYSIINLKYKCKFFYISKILIKLSKYSIYMWLIHMFFAKYYFQQIILLPKYTFFIFILLFVVSLVSAILIDKLYIYIKKHYCILNLNCIFKYYYQIYLILSFILWIKFIVFIYKNI